MQALNLSMRGVLGTRNKLKTHDCERSVTHDIKRQSNGVLVKLGNNFTSTPFDYTYKLKEYIRHVGVPTVYTNITTGKWCKHLKLTLDILRSDSLSELNKQTSTSAVNFLIVQLLTGTKIRK